MCFKLQMQMQMLREDYKCSWIVLRREKTRPKLWVETLTCFGEKTGENFKNVIKCRNSSFNFDLDFFNDGGLFILI